jgi:myo-inositol-1(or 4)-monophosphatase
VTSERSGRTFDAELAAAHRAVDDAAAVLRDGRAGHRSLARIAKAAKDFLTEVDLASEAALKRALGATTPDIGFFGEEGGGDALDRGRVWVADPLDGTINYAHGSPLCGVMLALVEDGQPVLSVTDLPFLGMRLDACAGGGARLDREHIQVSDVPSVADAIVAMGDAFHRTGPRHTAFLHLTTVVHSRALRLRCVGSAAVLWSWLATGQVHGVILAHNNPYDVAAGHVLASEAGATVTDYAGLPLRLDSPGAMACVPGAHAELVALSTDLARAASSF